MCSFLLKSAPKVLKCQVIAPSKFWHLHGLGPCSASVSHTIRSKPQVSHATHWCLRCSRLWWLHEAQYFVCSRMSNHQNLISTSTVTIRWGLQPSVQYGSPVWSKLLIDGENYRLGSLRITRPAEQDMGFSEMSAIRGSKNPL